MTTIIIIFIVYVNVLYVFILGLDLAQLVEGLSRGMRLKKPSLCPPPIANMISKCFNIEPDKRPNFAEIKDILNVSKKNLFHIPSRKKKLLDIPGKEYVTPNLAFEYYQFIAI